MIQMIENLKIDDNVYNYCIDYVKNNLYNRDYDSKRLFEYYPEKYIFFTNLNIIDFCIGVLSTGDISMHIDDDRESSLIIPICPKTITIITEEDIIKLNSPFILDTTKLHSARSEPNAIFLALDFKQSFLNLCDYMLTDINYVLEIDNAHSTT
jgi:hypothetical protein